MYELLGSIAFYSPLIINPEKLIKNPEISSDGASANLALKLPLYLDIYESSCGSFYIFECLVQHSKFNSFVNPFSFIILSFSGEPKVCFLLMI